MPTRMCTTAGCPHTAAYKGRCAEHAAAYNRATHSNREVYDTKRWRNTRRAQLARQPICERCDARLATQVHHRQDLAQGGNPWAPDNLESLCGSCHSRHTRLQQTGA